MDCQAMKVLGTRLVPDNTDDCEPEIYVDTNFWYIFLFILVFQMGSSFLSFKLFATT